MLTFRLVLSRRSRRAIIARAKPSENLRRPGPGFRRIDTHASKNWRQ